MVDGHIHLERGEYSREWVSRFVDQALACGLHEIWLLEHCYRFREFVPMYDSVCTYSDYINTWFHQKAGVLELSDYLHLIHDIRQHPFPIKIKFGLEICYFKEFESFIVDTAAGKGFDFLLGSVHFVDGFAFDHKPEHWSHVDVDTVYRRFFETSIDLANSGIYDGIAHPDSIKLFGHLPSFSLQPYYEELACSLSRQNMYAEQSSGIYRRCPGTAELGMTHDLLVCMKRHHVPIITVSDAHCPKDVGAKIPELAALLE